MYLSLRALIIIAALFLFNFANAHWSTRGPYGGAVSCFTTVDTFTFLGSPTGGVYRCTNNQLTGWIYRNYTGLGSGKINALTSIGTKVIAATADSGVYISNDLGVTWAQSNAGLSNLEVLAVTTSNNGKLYAGTNGGGVFRSVDSGATWVAMNSGIGSMVINCFLTLGDSVLAGTGGAGTYISISGGAAWFTFSNGLTDLNIKTLAVSPTTFKAYAGTASGVFEGTLATFSWALSNTGLTNTHVNSLAINGPTIYAGTDAGVFTSSLSGISWSAAGSLVDTVKALSASASTLLAGTKHNGAMKSATGAFSWSAINSGFNNLISYAAAAKDSFVVMANEQGVFHCDNFVVSAVYVKSNTGLTDSFHVTALQLNAAHAVYAGTKNAGVFTSADGGNSWSAANAGLTSISVVKLLATATKLYAATSDGKVFSTLQSGLNWTDLSAGIPANSNITALANIGNDTIFVSTTTGVFLRLGAGSFMNIGLNQNVTSLAIKDGFALAGTDGAGVFRASFSNQVWSAVNTNLPTLNISALYAVDQFVVAGYRGGAMATCNGGQTWKDFDILQYIPNFGDVIGFTDITPRIFALVSVEGLMGNSKAEYPQATPATPVAINGPSPVCGTVPVTFSVANDADALSYQWTLPNGWTGSSATNSITATPVVGDDSILVTLSNGCGTSDPQVLHVVTSTTPTVTFSLNTTTLCSDAAPLLLSGGSPANGVYSGAGVNSGGFDPVVAGLGAHVITYTYTNMAGCADSATATMTVTTCSGIEEIGNVKMQLYPNPFANQFTVNATAASGIASVIMEDVTGRTIMQSALSNGVVTFNTEHLSKGVYVISLREKGKTVVTQRLVKSE